MKEDGTEEQIEDTEGKRVYFATSADVGCVVGFYFVPVREDGVEGEACVEFTEPITAGMHLFIIIIIFCCFYSKLTYLPDRSNCFGTNCKC